MNQPDILLTDLTLEPIYPKYSKNKVVQSIKKKIKLPVSYWQRHITFLLKYGSIKKHFNLLRALINWKLGNEVIGNMPAFLKIEISRECKVGCKFCLTEKPTWFYSLENYKQLIDKFQHYSYLVSLYDIGEPLEHSEMNECITYAHNKKLGTVISTSLAVERTDDFWKKLVKSGLDLLIVAIDGVTKEVYNKYRTNADFDLVMSNLKKIIHFKKLYGSNICIEWQMIDFVWNKEEHEPGRKLALELGCDRFRLIKEVVKARRNYFKDTFIRKKNCILPYILLLVTANNLVRPCYKIYNEKVEIGDLNMNSFEEIWNGDEVKRIRNKNLIGCRTGCKTCRG